MYVIDWLAFTYTRVVCLFVENTIYSGRQKGMTLTRKKSLEYSVGAAFDAIRIAAQEHAVVLLYSE